MKSIWTLGLKKAVWTRFQHSFLLLEGSITLLDAPCYCNQLTPQRKKCERNKVSSKFLILKANHS
jgi:hypothetical protein